MVKIQSLGSSAMTSRRLSKLSRPLFAAVLLAALSAAPEARAQAGRQVGVAAAVMRSLSWPSSAWDISIRAIDWICQSEARRSRSATGKRKSRNCDSPERGLELRFQSYCSPIDKVAVNFVCLRAKAMSRR